MTAGLPLHRTSAATPATREARESTAPPRWPLPLRQAVDRSSLCAHGVERWEEVGKRFGLTAPAVAVGALLLACELDMDLYHTLVGAGAHEERPSMPTRGSVVSALREELNEIEVVRGLEQLEAEGLVLAREAASVPWFAGAIVLTSEVRAYCLSSRAVAARSNGSDSPEFYPRLELELARAAARAREADGRGCIIVVRGGRGSGRDTAVAKLLEMTGKRALVRSSRDLREPFVSLEPVLSGDVAVWDARGADPSVEERGLAERWLARSTTFAIALLDRHQDPPDVAGRRSSFIEIDACSSWEREQLWQRVLARAGAEPSALGGVPAALAARSRAGAGLASRAVSRIERVPERAAELLVAVEQSLNALTLPSSQRGIVVEHPDLLWSRLVLSPSVATALEHLLVLIESAAELSARGRAGVKALFAGTSGTGKTLAARAVASRLGLPLYRLDLSAVVSKWVGETEKNLRHVLETAESTGALLLFDEGDALFSKRGEVTRGSDRYANLEVAYLLQAIEAHDGTIILTTNLRQNVDSAFNRRFDVCIDFPRPEAQERARLWIQELGDAAGDTLGLAFVKEISGAELSGGSIAAAARLAIALARARGDRCVGGADVCTAIAAEFQKAGSSVQAGQWNAQARSRSRSAEEAPRAGGPSTEERRKG